MHRLIIFLFLLFAGALHATNWFPATASVSDVQGSINSAASGDTVVVPSGSVTINTTGLSIPNTKGITLDGSAGVTYIAGTGTMSLVTVATNATTISRVTGFTFLDNRGSGANRTVSVTGSFTNSKHRIDHCIFTSTAGSQVFVDWWAVWGLIDHCTFRSDDASEMIHNMAWGAGVTTGWTDTVVPGDGNALVIEDCAFAKYDLTSAYFWGTSSVQSYNGARTYIRHCTFNYCQIDQHGTPGAVGARWWEIGHNTFVCPANSGQSQWMQIRAGSGVINDNTFFIGSGAVTPNVQLVEEDTGWPADYQIGRGINQTSDPAYCWNNSGAGSTPYGGSANVVDGRDFYSNTQKPGYTEYTYPHPLQGGAPASPSVARLRRGFIFH